jgi:hypothetical protein
MKGLGILILTTFCLTLSAQEYLPKETNSSHIADELVGFQDDDINYQELYENYLQLIANPLNLNIAKAEDLRMLNILSAKQIESFFNHKTSYGNLVSVYELQTIPDFDLATIHKIIPYVFVADPKSRVDRSLLKRIIHEQNNYFIARYERTLETSAGFKHQENPNSKFQGRADKLYLRFRHSRPHDFSFGFTAEKDAGEQIAWNPGRHQYGPDYLSFHGQIVNKKKLQNFIVGDFQAQFAQGLLLGGAFGLGKGGETVLTARKSDVGFLPYTSVNEGGYFRGIAGTVEVSKNISMSGFFSHVLRDGSTDTSSHETIVSSLLTSGLHRSSAELDKRKNISETNFGTVLQYQQARLNAGIIFHRTHFNTPIKKQETPYNQFVFQGIENFNAGMFVNYTVHNFNFFTEAARSFHGGSGLITGMLASLDPKLDMAVLYRRYDRNFYSFYTNAFSESTTPQNESGVYWGWKYRANRKFMLAGYTDFFSFPWLKFRSYAPSVGYEWLLKISYTPSRKITVYGQVRTEAKERNTSTDLTLYRTAKGIKNNYCLNFDYEIGSGLHSKTRAQFSNYSISSKKTSGMVVLQDLVFSISKFQFSVRHALFDTDDFDNRQYAYENDVWLAYSLPAYQGIGIRNYLLLEYKASKRISFWLRYSRTRYKDQDSIGTGADKIAGNTKNDIKFQVRLSL